MRFLMVAVSLASMAIVGMASEEYTKCITDVINKTVKESEEKNDTAAPCVEAMKQSLFQGLAQVTDIQDVEERYSKLLKKFDADLLNLKSCLNEKNVPKNDIADIGEIWQMGEDDAHDKCHNL